MSFNSPLGSSQEVLCEAFGFAAPAIAAFTNIIVAFDAYQSAGQPAAELLPLCNCSKQECRQDLVQTVSTDQGTVQHFTLTFDGSAFSDVDLNNAAFGCQV